MKRNKIILIIGILISLTGLTLDLQSRELSKWGVSPFKVLTRAIELERSNANTNRGDISTFELQGIWKIRNEFKAMVSNQIVSIQDDIGDYTVIDITPNQVTLESKSNKRQRTLELIKK